MELVLELNSLEKLNLEPIKMLNNYKSNNYFKTAVIQRKVSRIIGLANRYLIEGDGNPNYDMIEQLKSLGYYVGPGERDRFGWLTAIIETKKGMILFG